MRISSIAGIVLILVGVIGLVWGGLEFTTEEQVADIGPVEVEAEETERLPIPPVAGGAALIVGLVLVAYGSRKS